MPPLTMRLRSMIRALSTGAGVLALISTVLLVVAPSAYAADQLVPVGPTPTRIAVSPDGSFAYVTNYDGCSISRIRTADNTVTTVDLRTSSGDGCNPSPIVISPDGSFAYVGGRGWLMRIRTSDNTVISTTSDKDFNIRDIAISPDGSLAYVVTNNDFAGVAALLRVRVSDGSLAPVMTFRLGIENPTGIVFSRDGEFAYLVRDAGGVGAFMRIRTSDNVVASSTTFGPVPTQESSPWLMPRRVVLSPDGTYVYIITTTNRSPGPVYRLRTADGAETARFWLGDEAVELAFTPDGSYAYATLRDWDGQDTYLGRVPWMVLGGFG